MRVGGQIGWPYRWWRNPAQAWWATRCKCGMRSEAKLLWCMWKGAGSWASEIRFDVLIRTPTPVEDSSSSIVVQKTDFFRLAEKVFSLWSSLLWPKTTHLDRKRPPEWRVKWSCCIKRANQIDTYTLNWLKIPKWIRQSGWHNSFSWEIPAKMHFWLFKSNCCQPQRQDQCDFSFTGRSNKEHGV